MNGLVQLSMRDGEVLHVTYFLKDVEKMRQAMQLIMPYIRKNKESAAVSLLTEKMERATLKTESEYFFGAGCKSLPVVFGLRPSAHKPQGRIRCDSEADSTVWMREEMLWERNRILSLFIFKRSAPPKSGAFFLYLQNERKAAVR